MTSSKCCLSADELYALDVSSRQGVIQIHVYLYLYAEPD